MSLGGPGAPPPGVFDMAAAALSVVDNLNDAVVLADTAGTVVYANEAIRRVLGWDPAALVGRPVATLVPDRFQSQHAAGFRRFIDDGVGHVLGQPIRISGRTSAGTERLIELVLSSLTLGDGTLVVASTIRDVSERVDLERQTALANHLLRIFTRDLGAPELVRETLAALGRSLAIPASAFWAPTRGGALRCEAFWRAAGAGAALEATSRRLDLRPGEGLPGRVWASREPAWITSLSDDRNFVRRVEVARDGFRSAFAFPVRARREVLGVIELYTANPTEPDDALLQLMSLVGQRLGEALYSARLEEERRFLAEREQAVAAAFRESLLPDVVPEISHLEVGTAFAPGGEGVVGGDFYDVYPLPPKDGVARWGVTIGDVCGTGPQAAAVTSKVRYTARALVRAGIDLVDVGEQINTAMSSRRQRRFCTAILGEVRVQADEVELRLVNAGHPPPAVRRADGTVELLPATGSLLGGLPTVRLVEQRLRLSPGDVVVLYTDGVTEARRDGELLGEDRLTDQVARLGGGAAALADGLRRYVRSYAGGRLSDDVAILVLGRPA